MEEMVPIVDAQNQVIDVVPRSVMRSKRLPHRASYIVLVNSQQQVYVEVRTMSKDYCPGMLDACVGGVMNDQETSIIDSAQRELAEELGVHTPLHYFGWLQIHSPYGGFTYAGLFYGQYDGEIQKQESEVSAVLMMTYAEIMEHRQEFTPDSIVALQTIMQRLQIEHA